MYMILKWEADDSYLTCIKNESESIRLFNSVAEADEFANKHPQTDNLRVISIEGVK